MRWRFYVGHDSTEDIRALFPLALTCRGGIPSQEWEARRPGAVALPRQWNIQFLIGVVTQREVLTCPIPSTRGMAQVFYPGKKQAVVQRAISLFKVSDLICNKIWRSLNQRALEKKWRLSWTTIGMRQIYWKFRLNCRQVHLQERNEERDSRKEPSWVKTNIKH